MNKTMIVDLLKEILYSYSEYEILNVIYETNRFEIDFGPYYLKSILKNIDKNTKHVPNEIILSCDNSWKDVEKKCKNILKNKKLCNLAEKEIKDFVKMHGDSYRLTHAIAYQIMFEESNKTYTKKEHNIYGLGKVEE